MGRIHATRPVEFTGNIKDKSQQFNCTCVTT